MRPAARRCAAGTSRCHRPAGDPCLASTAASTERIGVGADIRDQTSRRLGSVRWDADRPVRSSGDADPVGAPARRVPVRAARPGPVLRRTGRGHRRDGHLPVDGDMNGTSPAGRTVLDVGGGPGYFADAFADAGLQYIGVEPDPTRDARRAPRRRRGRAGTFVRASGMALPFADDSVDICLSSNVAEHVPRAVAAWPRDAARHPARRPGGAVLHGVARPVRRARDGADRTISAALAPPTATPANTGIGRRTTTARRCSRCPRPTGCEWAASTGRSGRRISPLPPAMGLVDDARPGAPGIPVSNLVLVLRPS